MKMRLIPICLSAVCLAATFALAMPQNPPPGRGPRGNDNPPARQEGLPAWDDTARFLRENSPHRYAMVLKLPENRQQGWKQYWIRQYAQVVGLLNDGDTELAGLKTRQIKIDDDLFAKIFDLNQALSAQPVQENQVNDIKGQLHNLARQKVEADIREREIRIARAENALAEAKEQLLQDKSKIDQLIEDQFRRTLPGGRRQPRHDDGRNGGETRH